MTKGMSKVWALPSMLYRMTKNSRN